MPTFPAQSRGLALIAVLWIVAALSVLITGSIRSVKGELSLSAAVREKAQGTALAEAAIQLVLKKIVISKNGVNSALAESVTFNGVSMEVKVLPLSGFIDINHASPDLLAQLFLLSGVTDGAQAGSLAQAVVDARTSKNAQGRDARFEATEDLLRIPGFTYSLYSRIYSLITADVSGAGKVNALAAPEGVLAILAGGNQSAVSEIVGARASKQPGIDTTRLNPAWIDGAASSSLELQASVPLADASEVQLTQRVVLTPTSPDGLPWRVFYGQSRYLLAPSKRR